jgi:hypothetical protein
MVQNLFLKCDLKTSHHTSVIIAATLSVVQSCKYTTECCQNELLKALNI